MTRGGFLRALAAVAVAPAAAARAAAARVPPPARSFLGLGPATARASSSGYAAGGGITARFYGVSMLDLLEQDDVDWGTDSIRVQLRTADGDVDDVELAGDATWPAGTGDVTWRAVGTGPWTHVFNPGDPDGRG